MNSLNEALRLFKTYAGLSTTIEKKRELGEKFRLEFNYNSNHLEGNTLTYADTKLLLIFDNIQGAYDFRELEEMKSHDVAYNLISDWANDNDRPLNEQMIKHLNEILLVRPFYKDALTPDGTKTKRLIKVGEYKEHPNSVLLSNGEMFHYASVIDTPIQMRELIDWYRANEARLDPISLAAELHYRFVRIHPFDDGNGRVARLVMNYVLLKHRFPPVIIKSIDKDSYLRALRQADVGNLEAFIDYVGQNAIWSLELSIKAANGENIEEVADWMKKLHLLKAELNTTEGIKKVKNKEVIVELVKKEIFPFFDWLKIQLNETFSDLFMSTTFTYLSKENSAAYLYENTENSIINFEANVNSFSDSLYLDVDFFTFKKNGTRPFNIELRVPVFFDEYTYSIKMTGRSFEKFYHQTLNSNDWVEIWNLFGSLMFESIQGKLKASI